MSIWDVVVRILLTAVLAGVIGLEREIREHTAGFRTHILVAVGASAIALASYHLVRAPLPTPLASPLRSSRASASWAREPSFVTGPTVKDLTRAASLWTVAAVGLLAGQGFFSAALVTTEVVILSLYALQFIEERLLYPHRGATAAMHVHFRTSGYAPIVELLTALDQSHVAVKEMAVDLGEEAADTVHLRLKLPRAPSPEKAYAEIAELTEVETVGLE
jgi:putative Mg2+ transporter-C (MgtC) family protein